MHSVTIIDIGETVLCDLCNGDYTGSDAEGGLLIGSHAVCPECAPNIRKSADAHAEPVTACPPGMRFRDWVLTLLSNAGGGTDPAQKLFSYG